ncbi:MAG: hypothetical protein ABSF67_17510 [Roseiarcus sp.]|jgi:hypothetical protein
MSFAFPDRDPFDAFPQPPSEEAPPRPGATLDHFIGRRRSTAVGRRFWRFVAQNWAAFDGIERARCVRMFARFRPDWARDAFGPEDRAIYDSLPETFTAYRGQNGVELAAGAAFSLSLERARRQATVRRGAEAADPRVFALQAAKREVALAFAAEGEGEIVMFPAPRVDLRARRLIELAN